MAVPSQLFAEWFASYLRKWCDVRQVSRIPALLAVTVADVEGYITLAFHGRPERRRPSAEMLAMMLGLASRGAYRPFR